MGYNTEFAGKFVLWPALTAEQVNVVQQFSQTRHDFEWLFGCWCHWTVSDNGEIFQWNGGEKFYAYVSWLEYLYYMFFSKWQVTMEGCIYWWGTNNDNDEGSIRAAPYIDDDGMQRTKFTVTAATLAVETLSGLSVTRERPLTLEVKKVTIGADPVAGTCRGFFDNLPVEILARIACFMDVEVVMRFQAVCKRTYACCNSKIFQREWCEKWKQKTRHLFIVQKEEGIKCYKLGKQSKEVFPILKLVPALDYTPVSASEGLICCSNGAKIMVGNPVIKQWLELPACPIVRFCKWHLITYPDSGDAGSLFFIVVDATCRCWFNSKLGTWISLDDRAYDFLISSANLLRFSEDEKTYVLVQLQSYDHKRQKGLLQLDLEDIANSRLLCKWDEHPLSSLCNVKELGLLEHNGKIVIRTPEGFWAMEQSSWSWEPLVDADSDEFLKWRQIPRAFTIEIKQVLPLELTLASASIKLDVDKQFCATKYWGSPSPEAQDSELSLAFTLHVMTD